MANDLQYTTHLQYTTIAMELRQLSDVYRTSTSTDIASQLLGYTIPSNSAILQKRQQLKEMAQRIVATATNKRSVTTPITCHMDIFECVEKITHHLTGSDYMLYTTPIIAEDINTIMMEQITAISTTHLIRLNTDIMSLLSADKTIMYKCGLFALVDMLGGDPMSYALNNYRAAILRFGNIPLDMLHELITTVRRLYIRTNARMSVMYPLLFVRTLYVLAQTIEQQTYTLRDSEHYSILVHECRYLIKWTNNTVAANGMATTTNCMTFETECLSYYYRLQQKHEYYLTRCKLIDTIVYIRQYYPEYESVVQDIVFQTPKIEAENNLASITSYAIIFFVCTGIIIGIMTIGYITHRRYRQSKIVPPS